MSNQQLVEVERTLTTALVNWSVASIVMGTSIALTGQRRGHRQLTAFGRQTAAWGAVDAVIVGVGLISQKRRGTLSEDAAQSQIRKLRKLLLINAAADVGYIAGGISILSRSRGKKSLFRMGSGDGLAIVIQGAFLFVLDVSQARRLQEKLQPSG
jgi:hypothetical protein